MFLPGTVSKAQAQGGREDQQDYIVSKSFLHFRHGWGHLVGVLDGHGGREVSFIGKMMIPVIFDVRAKDMETEMARTIAMLHLHTDLYESGSTLSLAYINEVQQTVTTAVLGDSPILVIDENDILHVSIEHNVRSNLNERMAAVARGAVYRQDGYITNAPDNDYGLPSDEGLQVSRALGDKVFTHLLDRTPDINTYRLGSKSMVFVASDGLFDPGHAKEDPELLQKLLVEIEKGGNAEAILKWREKQGELKDNASLVLWRPKTLWNMF